MLCRVAAASDRATTCRPRTTAVHYVYYIGRTDELKRGELLLASGPTSRHHRSRHVAAPAERRAPGDDALPVGLASVECAAGEVALDPVAIAAYRRWATRDFLAQRRARLRPEDVGLPARTRRRVPGLNRAEVAELCGITPWWYERFESQRDAVVSRGTLDAIARALRLDVAERRYLTLLVTGTDPPPKLPAPDDLWPLATTPDLVALVIFDANYQRIRANRLHDAIFDYDEREPPARNNAIVRTFQDPSRRSLWDDWHAVARRMVGKLRYQCALSGIVPAVVDDLADDEAFQKLWRGHEIDLPESVRDFTLHHPAAGSLAMRVVAPRMQPGYLFGMYVPRDDTTTERLRLLLAPH